MKTIQQRLRDAMKAGYVIEWLPPTPVAAACAAQFKRPLKSLPHFVKA